MLEWMFWGLAAVLGLIGMAMLVAGWELVRRNRHSPSQPVPIRVHSIDLNLGEAAAPAAVPGSPDTDPPPTDSDARRRALVLAIERMSEPARPSAGKLSTAKEPWEDTRPRVSAPAVERTPPT